MPPKRARVEEEDQTNETMQDLNGTVEELEKTRRELDEMTRTMLAPFGHEAVKVHGEEEYHSADRLIIPKFPDGARSEEQGPSSSGRNPRRDDGQGESRQSEEPMQQDPDQAEEEDDKVSTGGMSSLEFNFLSDF